MYTTSETSTQRQAFGSKVLYFNLGFSNQNIPFFELVTHSTIAENLFSEQYQNKYH